MEIILNDIEIRILGCLIETEKHFIRYTHTFSGAIKINSNIHQEISSPQTQEINRIAQLEKEIGELKKEI